MDIHSLSEEDIKLRYITPAILSKDWAFEDISMEMQVKLTDGNINLKGNMVARSKPNYADYVLYYNRATPIAIVEAKVLKGRPYLTPICNVGYLYHDG